MFYVCTGEPSNCTLSESMNIILNTIAMQEGECNKLLISFYLDPIFPAFDNADFGLFIHIINEPNLRMMSWNYSSSIVNYNFEITDHLQGKNVTFMFLPASLGLAETAGFIYSFATVLIAPTNDLLPAYYYTN